MTFVPLLPHRPPAALLHPLHECSSDAIEVAASFPVDSPFAAGDRVPAYALLEVAAQAAGLLEAELRRGQGQSEPLRSGYLVRARGIALAVADVAVGERLVARATRTGAVGPLATFSVSVEVGGVVALSGTLTTWLP